MPIITPAGGEQFNLISWRTARYYDINSAVTGIAEATGAMAADTLYGIPFYVPNPAGVTLDRIGINVTTAGAAGKLARLGIYDLGVDGLPSSLRIDAGEVAVDAIAAVQITISHYLPGGRWYVDGLISNGTPTIDRYGTSFNALGVTAISGALQAVWTRAFTYAALPSSFGATGTTGSFAFAVAHRVV